MKLLSVSICLLATGLLALPSQAQDAASQKESGALGATAKGSADDKDQKDKDQKDKDQKDKDQKDEDKGNDKTNKDKEAVAEKIVSEKDAIKQLVGDYRIVSGENGGEQVLPERLDDVTVRFTEKTVTTYDGERNERFSAVYRLDTQQRPWRIKMTSAPRGAAAGAPPNGAAPASTTSDGLIELAEGRVKVIYALPGGTAPKSFQTGERQQLFVLERLPDPAEKAKAAAAPADPKK